MAWSQYWTSFKKTFYCTQRPWSERQTRYIFVAGSSCADWSPVKVIVTPSDLCAEEGSSRVTTSGSLSLSRRVMALGIVAFVWYSQPVPFQKKTIRNQHLFSGTIKPPEVHIPPFPRSIKAWNSTNTKPWREVIVFEIEEIIVIPLPLDLHMLNIMELIRHQITGPRPFVCPIPARGLCLLL